MMPLTDDERVLIRILQHYKGLNSFQIINKV